MPIALIIIGLLLVVTGVKNTYAEFGAQVKSDFVGPGNFTYWVVAISIIGAVGYIKPLQKVANAFLALVLLAFILKNGGVFDKLKQAIEQGPTASPAKAAPDVPSSNSDNAATTGKQSSIGTGDVLAFATEFLPAVL